MRPLQALRVTCMGTQPHTHTVSPAHTRSHTLTHAHTHIHAHTHTRSTHTHTRTHTHTHTHTTSPAHTVPRRPRNSLGWAHSVAALHDGHLKGWGHVREGGRVAVVLLRSMACVGEAVWGWAVWG